MTVLGIEYSVFPDEGEDGYRFDLNETFEKLDRLEELRLHVELTSTPNFHHLSRLKTLRFLRFGWVADRGNLTLEAPADYGASHWLAKCRRRV